MSGNKEAAWLQEWRPKHKSEQEAEGDGTRGGRARCKDLKYNKSRDIDKDKKKGKDKRRRYKMEGKGDKKLNTLKVNDKHKEQNMCEERWCCHDCIWSPT